MDAFFPPALLLGQTLLLDLGFFPHTQLFRFSFFPPTRLLGPTLLLDFRIFSHRHCYLDSTVIRHPRVIFFLLFALQYPDASGAAKIVVDGTTVSYIADNDKPEEATITGTAIIEMQPGQKVSDSLLFYVA